MNDIRKHFLNIICAETGFDQNEISFDVDFKNQSSLDSMQLVSISARIENEFGIELPLSAMGVQNLNEFVDIIQKEVEKKASV
jgi:acyl carrier protein